MATIPSPDDFRRFISRCQHDAGTGCVLWTGGKTSGGGKSGLYGAFWFQGRRWYAHRWAAKFIHGQTIGNLQVDHCCPRVRHPNTLCVEHVAAVTAEINRELQSARRKQLWLLISKGYEEDFPKNSDPPFTEVPFYPAPAWLRSV